MSRRLLALALALTTACAPSSPPPASRATPPASAPPVAAAIHVGTSGDYPPLSLWKGDHAEGFAPSLLVSFAASERASLSWARFRWPELTRDFRSGRFDVVADGITVRPERSISGRFTVPIARGGAVLLLRRPAWAARLAGQDPKSAVVALDRPELRVVVNQGGHLERFTRQILHHAVIRAVPDNAAVRDLLARGEADAAMTNTFEAPRWAEGLAGVERLGPLSRDVTALWIRADRGELEERLDEWLLGEEASGRLDALRGSTLGAGAHKTAEPVSALFAAMAERLALMPFVAADKRRTGKPIEDRPQEERVLATATAAVAEAARSRGLAALPPEHVTTFFRAQIEGAKRLQEKATPDADAPAFSLQDDLRPAIARIDARIAFLLVRLPRSSRARDEREVVAEAREDLAESGLDAGSIDAIGKAVAAFGSR